MIFFRCWYVMDYLSMLWLLCIIIFLYKCRTWNHSEMILDLKFLLSHTGLIPSYSTQLLLMIWDSGGRTECAWGLANWKNFIRIFSKHIPTKRTSYRNSPKQTHFVFGIKQTKIIKRLKIEEDPYNTIWPNYSMTHSLEADHKSGNSSIRW